MKDAITIFLAGLVCAGAMILWPGLHQGDPDEAVVAAAQTLPIQ